MQHLFIQRIPRILTRGSLRRVVTNATQCEDPWRKSLLLLSYVALKNIHSISISWELPEEAGWTRRTSFASVVSHHAPGVTVASITVMRHPSGAIWWPWMLICTSFCQSVFAFAVAYVTIAGFQKNMRIFIIFRIKLMVFFTFLCRKKWI